MNLLYATAILKLTHHSQWSPSSRFEKYIKIASRLMRSVRLISQIREQMSVPGLYAVTVAFLALKKSGFSEIKKFPKIFF